MPEPSAAPVRIPEGARLVLATRNAGKLAELRAMLAQRLPDLDVEAAVVDAGSLGLPDVRETGTTFEENALLKARAAAEASGLPAVADDSGLAVDVLHGAPGIFSARWSGRHGDDRANLDLLLAQLADIDDEHRGAGFVCAAALVTPRGEERVELGRLRGTVLREPAGEHGFGYDPVLRPEGLELTCAQLEPEHKNRISHRGRAMAALAPHLVRLLSPGPGDDGTGRSEVS
ncbi:RdgB/HAM1 family non-canonical purine NTP pyrophosphatase [Kocuria palustris]|uniref:RdgB/HAM1 family non-canonical purine NTP pyrophosphatase n=1 Tax=Kocuria palustris TaxID=71999 RepID=UPI0011A8A735|nr:RdgB/HAM1 family non-canonical purine NTP pyrophosphatase [Kocuria palustris]